MPLDRPPPLGHRVPDLSHAISVHLPTWQDMCDMALGNPRVKQVQENGYPRSFLLRDVAQLAIICRRDYLNLSEDFSCLVFSNPRSARACLNFLYSPSSKDELVKTRNPDIHGFQTSKRPDGSTESTWPKIYVVAFPKEFLFNAMIFWRLTGTGVSSRFAAFWLETVQHASELEETLFNHSTWEQPWTDTHQTICKRIVDLLQRASLQPSKAAQLSTHDVFFYQSGMSAIYHVHQLLLKWKGAQSIVFGFPYELTLKMLQTYGPGCSFYPFGNDEELDSLEKFLEAQSLKDCYPQALWCESPSNPLLKTPNLKRLRGLADRYGFVLVVDDTIGSFANVDLLGIADIVITSLTKSFSGYSNVMAGSAILYPSGHHYKKLSELLLGTWSNDLFVEDAIQIEVNSRDFLQRVNRINSSTSQLVTYFEPLLRRPQSSLTAVYYPEICWSTNNYRAHMRQKTADFTPGYGGVFTLEFSSVKSAAAFFDAADVHKGPSLGANLTLMQPYVQTVFFKEKAWAAENGVNETIVRISVGLEDLELLLETFQAAIAEADRANSGETDPSTSRSCNSRNPGPLRSVL